MLKRNLIANYLGQGWTAVMGLAFATLYIQYLEIEAYGLIGLFAVLTAGLRPVSCLSWLLGKALRELGKDGRRG